LTRPKSGLIWLRTNRPWSFRVRNDHRYRRSNLRVFICPELWPSVLDDMAKLAGGQGGLLFAVRDKVLNWTSSPVLSEVFRAYVTDGWFAHCNRKICLFSKNEPRFLVEYDFWTEGQLEETPIYRDFFRPRGLGWSAGTGMAMPTGDNIVFSVEREFERGPMGREHVEPLNELRPHLARAALIAARLGLQSAKGASNALTAIGLPALVLDESGVVVDANALMSELPEQIHWRTQDRIALTDKRANEMLHAALPALAKPGGNSVHSFALRGTDGRAALVAHIVPIKRSAHDIFARGYALMIVTPVTGRRSPPVELVRSLFDLTTSEARVARGIAAGESLDQIAASGGVSRNTVRSQLQQVLEKTGCTRQAEVTALLTNIAIGQDSSAA
jgi:DNA-binding CsgD family transcriptional regulator